MGVLRADLGWVALALVSVTIAIRARRSPLDHPLPTSIAGGAVFGLAAALVALPFGVQAAIGATTTIVLLVVLWRWRALAAEDHLPPGVGGRRLVGLQAEVVEALGPDGGRVRVGSEVWRATAGDGHRITTGTPVTIIGVEGIRVVVTSVARSAELDQRGF